MALFIKRFLLFFLLLFLSAICIFLYFCPVIFMLQSVFLTRILVNLVSDYQCLRFFLRAEYPLTVYMTHR